MTRIDKRLPSGFSYLLTPRRGREILRRLPISDAKASAEGVSHSERTPRWILNLSTSTNSYCFAQAQLTREGEEWHLQLSLYGLRRSTIKADGPRVLQDVLPRFYSWVEGALATPPLRPIPTLRFPFEFSRLKSSGDLVLQEAAA